MEYGFDMDAACTSKWDKNQEVSYLAHNAGSIDVHTFRGLELIIT